MKKAVALLLGLMAFGAVGYIGGQAQSEPSEVIRQLELRIQALERAQAGRSDCACIPAPGPPIEVGGIQFYVVPVASDAGKAGSK
ncbi:MAG: hypothetical protein EHM23_31120 [Acidobacteria bacterium]|nr:MAG: hypothetical protein EHM23_31120 [Acidobacteriota bacterium]